MTSGYKTMKQWQDGLKIMRGEQSLREYLQRERPYLELITPDPLKAIQSVNELAMLFSEVETFSILTPEQQLDYLESIRGNVCDLLD